jgi:hypothetical protein
MPAAEKTRTSQALRKKSAVIFAVLLLVALQITSATHQFDHTVNELGDICSLCLQLDRLDDMGVADNSTALPSSVDSDYVGSVPLLMVVRGQVFSQPRAPPFS